MAPGTASVRLNGADRMAPDTLLIIVLSSLTASLSVLFVYLRLAPRAARPGADPAMSDAGRDEDVVFVFDGQALVDATRAAREMLPTATAGMDDWSRFALAFSPRFDGLETRLRALGDGETVRIDGGSDPTSGVVLHARRHGDLIRVALSEASPAGKPEILERYGLMAMRAELGTLRSIAEDSPVPTWKQRSDGTIVWANTAYMDLVREIGVSDNQLAWPPPDLFAGALPDSLPGKPVRVSVPGQDGDPPRWFEVTGRSGAGDQLVFAKPIDAQVRAETSLLAFLQTLTETFAHLTVGLAIFDRQRRLKLFNPALVDLTGLPPDQLSARPTLHSFLDALRDKQRIPEPKDYKSWRLHIAQLEAAAEDGQYAQTWHLPGGQTYRVTGRPHPDGAVAYMFEDISSEVSLTRNFRMEIEQARAILDGLDTAVAVFSRAGILTASNKAYRNLWGIDGDETSGPRRVGEAMALWQAMSQPSAAWTELHGLLQRGERRGPWCRPVELRDGTRLFCAARPLIGGTTLVSFDRDRQRQMTVAVPLLPHLPRTGT